MTPLLFLSASLSLGAAFNLGHSSSQRIPNSCSTQAGTSCVFPFIYSGVTHYQCTYADSPTPWCATGVDSTGTVVTNSWGDCDVSSTSSCQKESITLPSCTTTSGPRTGATCVFPFRHLGITYSTCTTVGKSAAWCSTTTDSAGTHVTGEYGFCPSTCPTTTSTSTTTTTPAPVTTTTTTPSSSVCTPGTTFLQDCNTCVCSSLGSPVCTTLTCTTTTTTTTPAPTTCTATSGPASGSACVFPFTYAGTTHTSCAEWVYGGENQGKFWCSTKVDSTGTHVNGEGNYGFCSSTCASSPKTTEFFGVRQATRNTGAVSFGGSSSFSSGKSASRPF